VCGLVYRRLCDDEDDLSEVTADAVPTQVRDWLALTFTRSMSSIKKTAQDKPKTAQDKPKFRSVAHVIRAGIMVDRSISPLYFAAKKYNNDDDVTRLMAIFRDNPGKPVPERLHSGFCLRSW